MSDTHRYPFLQVGVTGGIGSGKSTVCKLFSLKGRTVVMADIVARRIADEDIDVKKAIQREFGTSAYLPTGLLDRKRMAEIVFSDQERRAKLDSIIHPRVFKAIARQLDSLSFKQYHPYVLIEAALVYESGMDRSLDRVVVVAAEEEACVQRVMTRDKVSREEVLRRIHAQMPIEEKLARADFVIKNNGPESDLIPAVAFIDSLLPHIGATSVL